MSLSERPMEDMPEMLCHGCQLLESPRDTGKVQHTGEKTHDFLNQNIRKFFVRMHGGYNTSLALWKHNVNLLL